MNQFYQHFINITKIPHGSGNTAALRAYIKAFAEGKGFQTKEDTAGNLLVILPASPCLQETKPVVIQGHLDMVCEKVPQSAHNFLTDPLLLRRDGDWLSADGTTLGADDGIALAYMMALMEEEKLIAPKLYLLMTDEEETGMDGAEGLSPDWISDAGYMINIDSEEFGIFTIGSAGGIRIDARFSYPTKKAEGTAYTIDLTGLTGGHSGIAIYRFGASAVRLLSQILLDLSYEEGFDFELEDIRGGEKDNVIVKHASCELVVHGDTDLFEKRLDALTREYQAIFHVTDPDMSLSYQRAPQKTDEVFSAQDTQSILFILSQIPYGVQHMEEGEVVQSLNLGKVAAENGELELILGLRGNSKELVDGLTKKCANFIRIHDGEYDLTDAYPAWPKKEGSKLLTKMMKIHKNLTGEEPLVQAIHAGLECGLISEKCPDLDIVSIGPNLEGVHTPDERMHLPSAKMIYIFLKEVLASFASEPIPAYEPVEIFRSNGTPTTIEEICGVDVPSGEPDCSSCESDCPFSGN